MLARSAWRLPDQEAGRERFWARAAAAAGGGGAELQRRRAPRGVLRVAGGARLSYRSAGAAAGRQRLRRRVAAAAAAALPARARAAQGDQPGLRRRLQPGGRGDERARRRLPEQR